MSRVGWVVFYAVCVVTSQVLFRFDKDSGPTIYSDQIKSWLRVVHGQLFSNAQGPDIPVQNPSALTDGSPDEVRKSMEPADETSREMRCFEDIGPASVVETRGVEIFVESTEQGVHGGVYSWKYHLHFKNRGSATVQLLTRHWIFTDAKGEVEEIKGPGARGATPILKPGDSWEYESGARLNTPSGSMTGSFQFEVLAGDAGLPRTFSARVGRLALSQGKASVKVSVTSGKTREMLTTANSVFSSRRVIVGVIVSHVSSHSGIHTFEYDVQINNARSEAVVLDGHKWEVDDAEGVRHSVQGRGLGGHRGHGPIVLAPGRAFRYTGELRLPTATAIARGAFAARLGSAGDGESFEVRIGEVALAFDGKPVPRSGKRPLKH